MYGCFSWLKCSLLGYNLKIVSKLLCYLIASGKTNERESMEKFLEQNLKKLDFEIDTPTTNLLFTEKIYERDEISFGERLVLLSAKRLQATAVYFRRTVAGTSTIPQIFIYDNTQNNLTNEQLIEIHKKIWSSNIVSIYYVIDKVQVRIFDSRKPIDYKKNKASIDPLDTIDLVAEAQEKYQTYSAKLFENGSFWNRPQNVNHFLYKNSSITKLIEGLQNFKKYFIGKSSMNQDLAHKILVQSILIKYLEERRDDENNGVFEPKFFLQFNGASNFCEVIRKNQFVALLEKLSVHFNGKIFELDDSDKNYLKNTDLSLLADFLDANIDKNQYVLWRLYAFDYLPVEVISRIYEEFIPQRDDAVYTPIHLAQFMVDECMPLNTPQNDYKVIDISCGSGIFLVTAFKRLVQWWQKEQFNKTGKIEKPEVDLLQTILRNSICGIDIEPDAVRLTAFSLSIALCDMLSPTQIWLNLKFDNLEEENLYTGNFFEYLSQEKQKDFDLVIGNPPFKGNSQDVQPFIEQYQLTVPYQIPRGEIALLFLQQAMLLLKEKGLLCLVMPSGPLLYNNTLEYRQKFFSNYTVQQIIDTSALARKGYLFEREVSAAVIFASNTPPENEHKILHVTVKRSKVAKERQYFEIDYYDMFFVPQQIAITDPIVWKTNLLGGGQLYYLIKRLLSSRSLETYLQEKKLHNGWFFGGGYFLGKKDRNFIALHLTNKPLLESDNFTEDGIGEITIEHNEKFARPRKQQIFCGPHLLIKEVPGVNKFVIAYREDYLVFKKGIIGIYAPNEQKKQLQEIEYILQKHYKVLKFFLLLISSRAGISHSLRTLEKEDFMSLPFPEDETLLMLSKNEQIILEDVINYKLEEYEQGEKAKINTDNVNNEQLEEFGQIFCENLNSIYQTGGQKFYPLQLLEGLSYICYSFAYGDLEAKETPLTTSIDEEGLNSLLTNQQVSVLYQRVLRLYGPNIVYLIKPKTLRYWLKSVALRDATDVMNDLIEGGY